MDGGARRPFVFVEIRCISNKCLNMNLLILNNRMCFNLRVRGDSDITEIQISRFFKKKLIESTCANSFTRLSTTEIEKTA